MLLCHSFFFLFFLSFFLFFPFSFFVCLFKFWRALAILEKPHTPSTVKTGCRARSSKIAQTRQQGSSARSAPRKPAWGSLRETWRCGSPPEQSGGSSRPTLEGGREKETKSAETLQNRRLLGGNKRTRSCCGLSAPGSRGSEPTRSTPITIARYGRSRNKTQDFEELSSIRSAEPSQSFSPNLGSPSPPETPNLSHCVSCIGKYLLLEPLEGDHVFRAVHLHSGEELVCKVFDISCYQESLAPCFCLSAHSNINQITEIILGETKAYVFFERSYGDMHSFVRTCKKLREEEAARLFYQIASAVAHCHDGGLVLRDLKLRKFIFKDEERTRVKLESLEDAYILRGDDDSLSDKHGCPAYVSPEILNTSGSYSGKAADVWSLGVMLYTMLVGRYPFHDIEPSSLFSKIRRGQFNIPETLSPKAKCLIRSILRREPSERLTSQEILDHPWFSTDFSVSNSGYGAKEVSDQLVPDVNMEENLDPFFN
uniref:tribbles homolog 2 isoform X2 n=1 Tax=Nyctereutes procyonoides TaxID=34880 RepID=UPI00244539A4|nr:tribbles homolog 2 isoform X2 [Nyctereutes procyonoides]